MRALTVRNPWAHWIIHPADEYGTKDVENRTWTTSYRGELLIHAAAAWDKAHVGGGRGSSWPVSAMLGVVDLVDVHESAECHVRHAREQGYGCSPWGFDGHWHWVLANPRPFARPVPCTGALSVWKTDRLQTLVQQEIEHQLALTKVAA